MTDDHLHDEELSDAVDGVASPEVSSHLTTCGGCRSRLDAMRAAAQAVAAPPPAPSAARRDAAVARALGAVAPARRRPVVAPWMAAAALVALLLGAGGIVLAGRDDSNGGETAARQLDSPTAGGSADASGAVGGPLDAGDLGDQRDAVALNALLEERLAGTARSSSAPFAEDNAATATEGGGAAPGAPVAAAAATGCVAEAQAAGSDRVGALVLTARLRWQGEPAVVLVFAAPDQAQLGRRAFVMAQRDCRLLVVQSF
ncbi:MAG: hypothetical protein QOG87_859 [Actinomycetota bacterium]|jgi:hypothetical protein